MANRIIPTETKVNAMNQCLTLKNIDAVAKEWGVSPNSSVIGSRPRCCPVCPRRWQKNTQARNRK